jgi:polar amino acid transport system substrate-binding protein
MGRGELDALAIGMGALKDLSRKIPGTKVLDEVIQSTGVVVVVPNGKNLGRAVSE